MHPLDPLTVDEINTARKVVEKRFDGVDSIRFPSLVLAEPKKSVVNDPSGVFERQALAVVMVITMAMILKIVMMKIKTLMKRPAKRNCQEQKKKPLLNVSN